MDETVHTSGRRIDLNADLGESDDPAAVTRDIALMDHISSCNIACGGHAGDPQLMSRMVTEAARRGLAIGAHISYPDRANFGRVSLDINDSHLATSLQDQITALQAICAAAGFGITHVKPHGALYNDAADSPRLARLIANTIRNTVPDVALCGLAHSAMEAAAQEAGLVFWPEAFVDRRYGPNRRLLPRTMPEALLHHDNERIAQALAIARHHPILTNGGTAVSIHAATLCLHSDSPGALESAIALRKAINEEGIRIRYPER